MSYDEERERLANEADCAEIQAWALDRAASYGALEAIERISQADFNPRVLQNIVQRLLEKVQASNWAHTEIAEIALCALKNLFEDIKGST